MRAPRVTLSRDGGRTTVWIAAPRSWTMIVFLLFWMLGWTAGEVATWQSLVSGQIRASAYAYVALWLVVWSLGGLAGVVGLLWAFAGHEVVTVEGDTLALRRAAGPLGKTTRYPLAELGNLRYEPPTTGDRRTRAAPGAVAFDHRGRTVRFGTYLGATDGRAVVEALAPSLPAARGAR